MVSRMIQAIPFIVHFINIIMTTPPQIIRYLIQEVGDSCHQLKRMSQRERVSIFFSAFGIIQAVLIRVG